MINVYSEWYWSTVNGNDRPMMLFTKAAMAFEFQSYGFLRKLTKEVDFLIQQAFYKMYPMYHLDSMQINVHGNDYEMLRFSDNNSSFFSML